MAFVIVEMKVASDGKNWVNATCKSTDTKQTGFANGSIVTESDTGNVYFYVDGAASGSEWEQQFSFKTEG